MRYSVIVVTLNEAGVVGQLLGDIAKQTLLPHEVIVVDAGSTDSTHSEVFEHGAQLILHHPPVGGQRQRGGEVATAEWLVFLDADVRLDPDFFERMFAVAQKRNLEVVVPRYLPWEPTWSTWLVYHVFDVLFWAAQKVFPSGAGSAIAVRKDVWAQAGGFDEQLTYDDIAFIRAASRKGRFGQVRIPAYVSDRRFRKYGVVRTTLTYMLLSLFFMPGLFRLANAVPYAFGGYKSTGTDKKTRAL